MPVSNQMFGKSNRDTSDFNLKHGKKNPLSLTKLIIFDVTNLFIISLFVERISKDGKDKQNHT